MPDRVTFRERSRGVCVAEDVGGIQAVSIAEPRVKFIKGWLTGGTDPGDGSVECGDGSPDGFCLEITGSTHAEKMDRFREVYYGVKDTEVTSGNFTLSAFGSDWEIKATGVSPSSQFISYIGSGSDTAYSARGFFTISNEASPAVPLSDYDASHFGATYYYSAAGDDLAVRDIAARESTMWINVDESDPINLARHGWLWAGFKYPPGGAQLGYVSPDSFRTAFSQTFSNAFQSVYSSLAGVFGDTGGTEGLSEASIGFGDKVAFIDDAASGNPFDPGNRLFAAFGFTAVVVDSFSTQLAIHLSSRSDDAPGGSSAPAGISVTVKLSGGAELSCPLYFGDQESAFYPTDPDPVVGGADFVIEATEWWPYKTTAGAAAWNTTTGLPINGGPGA